jgi:hypothetical protein
MGCYTAGSGYDVLANGLTSSIVNVTLNLTLKPSNIFITSNGFNLLMYPSMTLELCISNCQTNGFAYAGLQTYFHTE